MNTKLKTIGKIILDSIYPPVCAVCDKPLGRDKGTDIFTGVHSLCAEELDLIDPPFCSKCGKHIEDNKEHCKDCEDTMHSYDRSCATFTMNTALKEAIYRFKYKGKQELAPFFANAMLYVNKNLFRFWKPDVIMPVPMYFKKERIRGYNQAELIADVMSAELNTATDSESLVRTTKTAPLKDASAAERKEILRDAFDVVTAQEGKTILLIDDIYTTGATLDACAKALKQARATSVYAATICTGAGL